ncbi:MAG TPA: hypothetical protein DEQ20_02495 [Desulfobulbaceae bacterium]|nr:MAG: hypothetical protein A2520_03550 [Deltaproteobacteria bacterium RIFOXYD12_FULL_53_23]HCC53783.1 hypothetical protein [Desulfobulbaceae bacterium]
MKTNETAKKGLYVGVGVGLVLFVLAGLLPGSLLGGVVGLKIVGALYGGPMTTAILPKIILAVSMLIGVMLSAVVYVLGPGMIGWSVGYMFEAARKRAEVGDAALSQVGAE